MSEEKKFCRRCGKEIKPTSKFCCYCGINQDPYEKVLTEKKETVTDQTIYSNTKYCSSNSDFYIIDFARTIARKSNTAIILYLVLNILIIAGIVGVFLNFSVLRALIAGILLYLISMTIALSPLGEAILRFQIGCKKITRTDQINRIEPIFREVYEKARLTNPNLPEDIQLYMNQDEGANAFATGRKTVCITRGLLNLPVEQIKAVLGHEFGHLSNHDTDLILVITVGNLIITMMLTAIRIVITVLCKIFELLLLFIGIFDFTGIVAIFSWIARGLTSLSNILIDKGIAGTMWLWTTIGTLMMMKSSRENEFEADAFSFRLGYGEELCAFFDDISCLEPAKGLFASLVSSHPATDDRVQKLQELGVKHSYNYEKNADTKESA